MKVLTFGGDCYAETSELCVKKVNGEPHAYIAAWTKSKRWDNSQWLQVSPLYEDVALAKEAMKNAISMINHNDFIDFSLNWLNPLEIN